MKSINIKGSGYIPVAERLKYFREQEAFESWVIRTKVMTKSTVDQECLVRCRIYDELGQIRAEEWAYEKAQSNDVNKMYHVENCSTSAQGRALGQIGIGIYGGEDDKEFPWIPSGKVDNLITNMRRTENKEERKQLAESVCKFYRVNRRFQTMIDKLIEHRDANI